MFLGGHDEVVSLVLVVHDVLQRDAQLVVETVEEILKNGKFKENQILKLIKILQLSSTMCHPFLYVEGQEKQKIF